MRDARKIVELTLALRDEHNIKLRWPCKRLVVISKEGFGDISEVIPAIIHEANVKDVLVTESLRSSTEHFVGTTSDSFDLYLDLEITDEIASERLVREFMRQVQFTRKKNRLNVSDRIDLIVVSKEDKIRQYLNEWREEIIAKVGAQNYETQKNDIEEDIKEKYPIFSELQYENTKVKIYMKKIP